MSGCSGMCLAACTVRRHHGQALSAVANSVHVAAVSAAANDAVLQQRSTAQSAALLQSSRAAFSLNVLRDIELTVSVSCEETGLWSETSKSVLK